MTLTLDLPPDLEARLKAEAARRGLSIADYMLELARSATSEAAPEETLDELMGPWPGDEPMPTSPADIVAYWERHGLIGTRPDITDSLEHARRLRRKAERRARS